MIRHFAPLPGLMLLAFAVYSSDVRCEPSVDREKLANQLLAEAKEALGSSIHSPVPTATSEYKERCANFVRFEADRSRELGWHNLKVLKLRPTDLTTSGQAIDLLEDLLRLTKSSDRYLHLMGDLCFDDGAENLHTLGATIVLSRS